MEPAPLEIVVSTDRTLSGETEGPVTVREGIRLTLEGTHEGSFELESGSELHVTGILRGGLDIGSLATVVISGDVIGPVQIRVAGTLVIEPKGRLSGDVVNYGSFTNSGARQGSVDGRLPDDRPGSMELPLGRLPDRI